MNKELVDFSNKIAELISNMNGESLPVIDLDSSTTSVINITINDFPCLVFVGMEDQVYDENGNPTKSLAERAVQPLLAVKVADNKSIQKLNGWLKMIEMQSFQQKIDKSDANELV